MSNMSFRNFNSGLISQQMSLNTAPIFPVQNSSPRLLQVFIRPPAKFRQSLAYFSVIPCEPCFWKIEIFFLLRRHNPVYTRGTLGCLLGFWPSGPKPCGGTDELQEGLAQPNNRDYYLPLEKSTVTEILWKAKEVTSQLHIDKYIDDTIKKMTFTNSQTTKDTYLLHLK